MSEDVRQPLLDAIEDHGPKAGRDLRRGVWTMLWNCTDQMPSWASELLDISGGCTYAQGVRSLPK